MARRRRNRAPRGWLPVIDLQPRLADGVDLIMGLAFAVAVAFFVIRSL